MNLEEASTIITQITTLDAKLVSLIHSMETKQDQINLNNQEIKKRINLEAINVKLDGEVKEIKKETDQMKHDIDTKATFLTNSGWVVPIPKRDNEYKGLIRM